MNRDPALEAEIEALKGLGLQDLRAVWARRMGYVPQHRSPDLLRRRLAYGWQVKAYGGLSAATRRRLRRLYDAFRADPDYTPLPSLGLKPGTRLTREWQGDLHRVLVLDDGFLWKDERFGSLSEVARRITGTRWSGPAFFGLKEVAK
jgi:hypothetical protein